MKAPSYKVVGYYISWGAGERQYAPKDIDANLLTHVNYAFALIKNGEIALADRDMDIENLAQLRRLKASHPHLKTLISIGGWAGSGEFSDIALTRESREKFATSVVAFIRAHGFDGADIDWEFPVAGGAEGNTARPADRKNFTLLVQVLRDWLNAAGKHDRRNYLLTAAIGNNEKYLQNTEMDKVAKILDWANVMTYDFNGPWSAFAGHNAPLYNDPSIKRDGSDDKFNVSTVVDLMLASGVPPSKLVLGLPFYGYSWQQCMAANNGQHQDCRGKGRGSWEAGALDFAEIDRTLVNKNGFVRYWNDVAKVPYLFNAELGEFISYDDLESFDAKIKFLKQKGLAGAMFWEVTADRNFVLQRKLARDLLGK